MHDQSTPTSTLVEGGRDEEYVPPSVVRLGSLAELTLGGAGDPDDGFGGAGDEGSV